MSELPKVVNGCSWKFVCKMGKGPRTNLYIIGGDPLTQLFFYYFLFIYFVFKRNAVSEKMNGQYFVGDPLTHLCNQYNRTFQPKHITSYCQDLDTR